MITLKEIAFYDDEFLSKTIGSKTKKRMRREYGDYNSGETLIFNDVTSIRPKKFTRPNFWTFVLEPLLIWEYFEEKKILRERDLWKTGYYAHGPFYEELIRNVTIDKFSSFIEFLCKLIRLIAVLFSGF